MDSKPFFMLKEQSHQFQEQFSADIKQVLLQLDSEVCTLIQDVDSVGRPRGGKKSLNAQMEFSKAKYEIFCSLTTEMEKMEQSWFSSLTEMRNAFLENVEIFLASTKLEEKPSVSIPRLGSKNSSITENIKSFSPSKIISSLYPKLPSLADIAKPLESPVHQDSESEEESESEDEPSVYFPTQQKRLNIAPKVSPIPKRQSTLRKPTRKTNVSPKTPQAVHFSIGMDVEEDLEVYSPELDMSSFQQRKSTPSRKSSHKVAAVPEDIEATPVMYKGRSKRKTLGDSAGFDTASPKRLKKPSRNTLSFANMDEGKSSISNLLDCDDESNCNVNYTPWIPLSSIDGKTPIQPGVYELKSAQAKRPAFIGSCDNLQAQLSLHKTLEKCGHKQLDKFIERNIKHIQVRYEYFNPAVDVQAEANLRIQSFITEFKTSPAYN